MNNTKHPKIEIEKSPRRRSLDIASGIVLLAMVLGVGYYYPKMGDTIVRHYGADGQPDGYGSREMIFVLPVISALIYVGMTLANRYPWHFNLPMKVTEANAPILYQKVTLMMSFLKFLCVLLFAYITYVTIQNALGYPTGLNMWVMIPLIALTMICPFILLFEKGKDG